MAQKTCILLADLPRLAAWFRAVTVHDEVASRVCLGDCSDTSSVSTASWNESQSCQAHPPCLTDGETEAQCGGFGSEGGLDPRLLSASVPKPNSRPMCLLSVPLFWALARGVEKRESYAACPGGWGWSWAGWDTLGEKPGLLCVWHLPRIQNAPKRRRRRRVTLKWSHIQQGEDLVGRPKVSPRSDPAQLNYSLTRRVQALS